MVLHFFPLWCVAMRAPGERVFFSMMNDTMSSTGGCAGHRAQKICYYCCCCLHTDKPKLTCSLFSQSLQSYMDINQHSKIKSQRWQISHMYMLLWASVTGILTQLKNVSLLLNLELVSEVEPLKSEGHLLNKDRVDKEWKEAAMV